MKGQNLTGGNLIFLILNLIQVIAQDDAGATDVQCYSDPVSRFGFLNCPFLFPFPYEMCRDLEEIWERDLCIS